MNRAALYIEEVVESLAFIGLHQLIRHDLFVSIQCFTKVKVLGWIEDMGMFLLAVKSNA